MEPTRASLCHSRKGWRLRGKAMLLALAVSAVAVGCGSDPGQVSTGASRPSPDGASATQDLDWEFLEDDGELPELVEDLFVFDGRELVVIDRYGGADHADPLDDRPRVADPRTGMWTTLAPLPFDLPFLANDLRRIDDGVVVLGTLCSPESLQTEEFQDDGYCQPATPATAVRPGGADGFVEIAIPRDANLAEFEGNAQLAGMEGSGELHLVIGTALYRLDDGRRWVRSVDLPTRAQVCAVEGRLVAVGQSADAAEGVQGSTVLYELVGDAWTLVPLPIAAEISVLTCGGDHALLSLRSEEPERFADLLITEEDVTPVELPTDLRTPYGLGIATWDGRQYIAGVSGATLGDGRFDVFDRASGRWVRADRPIGPGAVVHPLDGEVMVVVDASSSPPHPVTIERVLSLA